jgi:hypothetical protein
VRHSEVNSRKSTCTVIIRYTNPNPKYFDVGKTRRSQMHKFKQAVGLGVQRLGLSAPERHRKISICLMLILHFVKTVLRVEADYTSYLLTSEAITRAKRSTRKRHINRRRPAIRLQRCQGRFGMSPRYTLRSHVVEIEDP